MMTQTNKLCRPAIRKRFAKQLETMLQAQQKALEEDELSQRYTVARILQKYVRQKDVLTFSPSRRRIMLVGTTSMDRRRTSILDHTLVFPRQHNINPGWLWNNNVGRSIEECVAMITTGATMTCRLGRRVQVDCDSLLAALLSPMKTWDKERSCC